MSKQFTFVLKCQDKADGKTLVEAKENTDSFHKEISRLSSLLNLTEVIVYDQLRQTVGKPFAVETPFCRYFLIRENIN